jgi:hypothetical protein
MDNAQNCDSNRILLIIPKYSCKHYDICIADLSLFLPETGNMIEAEVYNCSPEQYKDFTLYCII